MFNFIFKFITMTMLHIKLSLVAAKFDTKPSPNHYINQLWIKKTRAHECVNSLWHSDGIWRHKTGSTLLQAMFCCLKPSPLPEAMLTRDYGHPSQHIFARNAKAMQKLSPRIKFLEIYFITCVNDFYDTYNEFCSSSSSKFYFQKNTTIKQ